MSWMAKLYETYESNVDRKELAEGEQLMPISHTLQNAHINIVISGEGKFLEAIVLEKTQVVLPATEKSAGRSSGEAPHPLADKIQYVAGDYANFGGLKKAYYPGYEALLTRWCESEFAHPAAQSVLKYVAKRSVVSDLVNCGILHADDGILLTKWEKEQEQPAIFKALPKEKGMLDQGSALVCWSVEVPGNPQAKTWQDPELQQSWVDFDSTNGGQIGLCFVKGETAVLASNHPAKIRHTGDKAKLISSNDTSGFTFRGRFTKGEQASRVSFDVTQKAHNALRWLISRKDQSFRNGDQVYVSWAVSGKAIPNPTMDIFDMFRADFKEAAADHSTDVGQSFAKKVKSLMSGYLGAGKLQANESIAVMGLDSATPGRMGVIYYRQTFAQDFLDTLEQWHCDFAWPQRQKITVDDGAKKPKDKVVWPICAPAPYKIWSAVYGDVLKSSETLKKNLMERMMPCIVEGKQLPIDIVNNSIKRATNRVAYKSDETWAWEQNLGIACALYKGFCKRTTNPKHHKEYAMALEQDNQSRDYLYGRLLAVAEKIESLALSFAGEKRLTTAERYMQRFADRPATTWPNIEHALGPYQQRLKGKVPPLEAAYKRLLDDINHLFQSGDFILDAKLSGEYLLGYHCQRRWLTDHKLVNSKWVSKTEITAADIDLTDASELTELTE
ncbi:MAG: CRISPR-associated protein Csd1 [Phenylobacterium sp.]|jgi:CRISPR-associated protein Csd1